MTKEQAQPVIIVEGGPEFAAADAAAHRAIVTRHIEGHTADHGQVFGGVVLPGSAGILAESHVQDPVLLIFDPPLAADGGCKPVALQEEATVGRLRTGSEGGP